MVKANQSNRDFDITRLLLKIRYYRQLQKIPQIDCAEKINISVRKYQRIENLEVPIDLFELSELLELFDTDLATFIRPKFFMKSIKRASFISECDFYSSISEVENFAKIFEDINFQSFIESNNFEELKNVSHFFDSKWPIYISDFRKSFVNVTLKDLSCRKSHLMDPSVGWESFEDFCGIVDCIWSNYNETRFIKMMMPKITPAGILNKQYFMHTVSNSKNHIFVIGVVI